KGKYYTNAPALRPNGYRFAGFQYSGEVVSFNPVRWMTQHGEYQYTGLNQQEWTIDFPTHAIFKKVGAK
ncbi:MAG: hypothetical protein DRJ03_28950, partial [Chloroflexi bacterium]